MAYTPRIVDAELHRRLAASGAVVVEGPKACGKTVTARQCAASEVLLDTDRAARDAVAIDPSLLLGGATPRLIDEWQIEPELWNHVRRAVDDRGEPGQFVLTGSAVPADDATRHTGAGRFSRLRMRPMTLDELGVGTAAVSLSGVLRGDPPRSADPGLRLDDLIELVVRGGWPGFRDLDLHDARLAVRDYLDQVRRTDLPRFDGVRRDPNRVGRVLQSLARHTATSASLQTIVRDTAGADTAAVDRDTVRNYLDALERLMIIEDLPAFRPHLRSSHALRLAATRHFADPSLAVAALGASPASLRADLRTFGLLFESLVLRDLRVYAQALDADLWHYRDESGLEVDAIITAQDGRRAAIEIKLGPGQVDAAAASLLRFADRIDPAREPTPVLVVVTGTGYGYLRPDGVRVVPVGALAP
jgi:predicted AAA+ superfamily ATPase